MSMCDSCQAMYDKWRFHVWPPIRGWVHIGNPNLSLMNYKAKQADRSKLVRRHLTDIKRDCPGPDHHKKEVAA